ncbi:ABC transporter ATP-binding protein [Burkholderia perseverans]|uniref:ABC transporter ATP-binding protein n=1 Tax=Burkholderia perseverans TaxID=2615214 RepID=UPI001FEF5B37|nr:ABC transporter ATP-binding protein [Burkholderia perseverans]
MCSDPVIRVDSVSKCFPIYSIPSDRLRQYGARWMRRALPAAARRLLPRHLVDADRHKLFWALRDVSFELGRGESVGILGMNGAGKSTLLQVVAGILKPTSGRVETHGRLAGLFELGSGFNPEFTGRENVFLNAAMLGFSRAEVLERFAEIEQFAGINAFIDCPVKTYSSGMMVRLAFAVQVQLKPDILIVDEALAVGDALFQKRCYERIERFLSDGGSLLFVSHDQESVRTLTDRALLLRDGQAVCTGTSSEVVLEYRRLLHEAENQQARDVLQYLSSTGAKRARTVVPAAAVGGAEADGLAAVAGEPDLGAPASAVPVAADPVSMPARNRSADMSFGDLDVEIVDTGIFDANGGSCNLFYPGDWIDIVVRYRVRKPVTHLNLGVRLRNKEGVKIYSGGTFNEDLLPHAPPGRTRTWDRAFAAGQVIELRQRFECRLGEGYYEVQAYVAEERMPVPGHQRMLHWVDESAFFRVSMNRFERWYGGVCDICPSLAVETRAPQAEPVAGESHG